MPKGDLIGGDIVARRPIEKRIYSLGLDLVDGGGGPLLLHQVQKFGRADVEARDAGGRQPHRPTGAGVFVHGKIILDSKGLPFVRATT